MSEVPEILAVAVLMFAIMGPIFWLINQTVKQKNQTDIEKLKIQQATLSAAAGVSNSSSQLAQSEAQAKTNSEVLATLKSITSELQRQNSRLQNLESIVTSPSFLSGQGLSPDYHRLSEEDQAAELAKQIAAREGRSSN